MSSSYKISYVGNGTTTNYAVVPDYIRKSHIFVTLDGVPTTDYTFFNDQIIQFNTAPGAGVVIEIVRRPPGDIPLNTFTGSVTTPTSLNENFKQALQLGTIFQDDAQEAINIANQSVQKSGDTMTGELRMSGQRIIGVGDPVNLQDVATKSWVTGIAFSGVNLPDFHWDGGFANSVYGGVFSFIDGGNA
jgi:hypothetical protein